MLDTQNARCRTITIRDSRSVRRERGSASFRSMENRVGGDFRFGNVHRTRPRSTSGTRLLARHQKTSETGVLRFGKCINHSISMTRKLVGPIRARGVDRSLFEQRFFCGHAIVAHGQPGIARASSRRWNEQGLSRENCPTFFSIQTKRFSPFAPGVRTGEGNYAR